MYAAEGKKTPTAGQQADKGFLHFMFDFILDIKTDGERLTFLKICLFNIWLRVR